MKKKFKYTMAVLSAILTVTLASCYVENDGPVGPTGKDGWSDIKIVTFNIFYNHWLRDNSQLNYWYFEYNTNLIDYYVVDNGAVLFYYGYIEPNGYVNKWYFIPFTNVYYDEASGRYYQKNFDAMYSFGKIEIEIRDNNPTRFNYPDDRDVRIKAIILEGTQYNLLKTKKTDLSNLSEVVNTLNANKNIER